MKRITLQKGFTLIEMITVLAIFALISGVVIFNYGKFRSETILTNMAYEVALSIREAQIYGVSARNSSATTPDFLIPYGVYLLKDSNQYYLFADNDKDEKFSGTSCADPSGDTCVTPYTLQQGVVISKIKLSPGCEERDKVSILFQRPNPEPIINPSGLNIPNISFVEMTLLASSGATRYVVVYNNGQVAVLNNPICSN